MKTTAIVAIAFVLLSRPLGAQEQKPVPKDSVRVFVPGCARGSIFTAGHRTEEHPGNVDIPEGTHLRMIGPKKVMADIKAHEGSMIEITGLMKKGQRLSDGIAIGGNVRIVPGQPGAGGRLPVDPAAGQILIDIEGWRQVVGDCPSK